MADVVAKSLADRDITYVVSSPLERAQETAAPIAAAHGLDVATDDRLIEAANHFQGLKFGVGDGSLRHPGTGPTCATRSRPSWGEPYTEQAARMLGRDAGRPGRGPRARGGLREPPAADLDHALLRRGPPPVARPAQARVHPRVGDVVHLRGRPHRRGDVLRAGARPCCRCRPARSSRPGHDARNHPSGACRPYGRCRRDRPGLRLGAGCLLAGRRHPGQPAGLELRRRATARSPRSRRPADALRSSSAGPRSDGTTLDLASLRGKVVVVNVWGSWCPPCREEAPVLKTVSDDLAAKDVAFVGIDTRDSDAAAKPFLDNLDLTYPNVVDEDGILLLAFKGDLNPQRDPLDARPRQAGPGRGARPRRRRRRHAARRHRPLVAEQG